MSQQDVSIATALAVLDLYAEAYTKRHGKPAQIGHLAARRALGPELMIPETMDLSTVPEGTADKIHVNDTTGTGNPAIVMEGNSPFCGCCHELSGCWTASVQELITERGMGVRLEAYATWAICIIPGPVQPAGGDACLADGQAHTEGVTTATCPRCADELNREINIGMALNGILQHVHTAQLEAYAAEARLRDLYSASIYDVEIVEGDSGEDLKRSLADARRALRDAERIVQVRQNLLDKN